jgi:hypothetical protein
MHARFRPNLQRDSHTMLLVSLVGILLLGIVGCGDDDPSDPGNGIPDNTITNNLTFTRQNGTPLVMGTDYAICCGIWEPGFNDNNTLKIFFYDPLLWTNPSQAESFWKLFIIKNKLQIDSSYDFPTSAESPLRMFLVDASSGNEISGDEEESSGTITIERLRCGPPVRIKFTIDVVLGSEFHLAPTVSVTGTFTATIYSNPSPLGCDFGM